MPPVTPVDDLELERMPRDRRLYVLAGVGTLRLAGIFSSSATAEAGDERWQLARRGFLRQSVEARDTAGVVVGEFEPRAFRRGGTLRWAGRVLAVRAASRWRERYALADGDRELAILEARSWGRRPVRVTVVEPEALEPGLLLFATFVVRGLAEDAESSSGGGAAVVASGT